MANRRGDDLILEAVRERDVDLLFVEELHCSPRFQRFIFERLWPPPCPVNWTADVVVRVRHSVSHFDEGISPGHSDDALITRRGETDIEVSYDVPQPHGILRLRALLENKIDANFTDLQPQRYRSRANRLLKERVCDQVRTALLAPLAYLDAQAANHFDVRISYEDVMTLFHERLADGDDDEPTRRWQYRYGFVQHAINQYRRDGVTVVHKGVSSFRQAYYEHILRLYPSIGIRKPKETGQWAGDAWMEFYDAFGPSATLRGNIKHKCPHGRVDLHLSGWAKHEPIVRADLQSLLESGMSVRIANKSLAVSIAVPAFHPQPGYEKVAAAAEVGMHAAARLQQWYRHNLEHLERIAAGIGLLEST